MRSVARQLVLPEVRLHLVPVRVRGPQVVAVKLPVGVALRVGRDDALQDRLHARRLPQLPLHDLHFRWN